MKQQRYAQNRTDDLARLFVYALVALLACSCENDIEKINTLTTAVILPDATGEHVELIYSDSAVVKARVVAEEIRRYSGQERPYIEFPKGMTATFFNNRLETESVIRANHVKYFTEERLWEAKNDVEARNLLTGEQLNTEHLFWDEEKQLIYSNTYSRIVNEDGTFYGENGFEANQNFSWWKLKGTKGTVNVKDE